MGRGKAIDNFQKAKERLEAASKIQAEIGALTMKAIEGDGIDAEIIMMLADQAVRESSPDYVSQQKTPPDDVTEE